MSNDELLGDEPTKTKSKKKSKRTEQIIDEPIDETFDALLESAAKTASRAASAKSKKGRRPGVEATGGWSNDIEGDENNGDATRFQPPIIRPNARRAAEEIVATNIPTIPTDEFDPDEPVDTAPQVAVAPEFSVYQVASFNDIEDEYSRERANQYIDRRIDIGILYQNLHLKEDLDMEDQKPWDWDKLFVEIRNAIPTPIVDS